MKRILLVVVAAMMFISTLAVPTLAHADGVGGTSCGGSGTCRP